MNSFELEFKRPMLTEPGVKYFINETLKQCHQFKQNYKHIIFNIVLFVIFFLILGVLLLYKYKGKLTPEEIETKELVKKQYILSKIRNFNDSKIKSQQELIPGLPHFENEFEIINK